MITTGTRLHEDDIFWLQITVNNALIVCSAQSLGTQRPISPPAVVRGVPVPEPALLRRCPDIVQHHETHAIGRLTIVVQANQIRMSDLSVAERLFEAPNELFV